MEYSIIYVSKAKNYFLGLYYKLLWKNYLEKENYIKLLSIDLVSK